MIVYCPLSFPIPVHLPRLSHLSVFTSSFLNPWNVKRLLSPSSLPMLHTLGLSGERSMNMDVLVPLKALLPQFEALSLSLESTFLELLAAMAGDQAFLDAVLNKTLWDLDAGRFEEYYGIGSVRYGLEQKLCEPCRSPIVCSTDLSFLLRQLSAFPPISNRLPLPSLPSTRSPKPSLLPSTSVCSSTPPPAFFARPSLLHPLTFSHRISSIVGRPPQSHRVIKNAHELFAQARSSRGNGRWSAREGVGLKLFRFARGSLCSSPASTHALLLAIS